jgi:hypothetical protein
MVFIFFHLKNHIYMTWIKLCGDGSILWILNMVIYTYLVL